jgi:hypothetical protein
MTPVRPALSQNASPLSIGNLMAESFRLTDEVRQPHLRRSGILCLSHGLPGALGPLLEPPGYFLQA